MTPQWTSVPATSWRLPDDACYLLARLVEEHKPNLIVECGSGRSTLVLAETLRANGAGTVVALEHDWDYWAETVKMLEERDLFTHAQVRQSHLDQGWYARETWADLNGIGMLLVDGPPGGSSRLARMPAVPLLRDRLLPGCLIVLDDVNRDAEKKIIREWGIKMTLVKHEKATLGYGIYQDG